MPFLGRIEVTLHECVAECVSSAAVAERVRELGVDYVQGFIAHKPEPLLDVLNGLKNDESRRMHELQLAL